jgi:hypothetical protein
MAWGRRAPVPHSPCTRYAGYIPPAAQQVTQFSLRQAPHLLAALAGQVQAEGPVAGVDGRVHKQRLLFSLQADIPHSLGHPCNCNWYVSNTPFADRM